MKKYVMKTSFYWVILSSLLLLPVTSSALGLFSTDTGYLVISEVDVNGDKFYDNVTLKLDFSTGKFELVGAENKPDNISAMPLESMEDQNIKMDFMGCTRSGRNEVTCHVKLTSLEGLDRKIIVYINSIIAPTFLYDDLGGTYKAKEVTIANLQSTASLIRATLIAGTPTLAKFKFKDISPSAS